MPTYEYECLRCRYRFEAYQHIKDKPLVRCPRCQGKIKRLIGAGSAIIFKGAGFFVNDYKKKPPKDVSLENKPTPERHQTQGKSEISGENNK